jgi:hypothetical protein
MEWIARGAMRVVVVLFPCVRHQGHFDRERLCARSIAQS